MLLAVLALYGNIHIYKLKKGVKCPALHSYIEACSIWMLILFAMTEGLSVLHELRFRTVFSIWIALDMILIAALTLQCRKLAGSVGGILTAWLHGLDIRKAPYEVILVVIGLVVLTLSLVTTPYNWDSMTYHLPRIAYWVQNRSVEHYATNSIRQIASPVLGEFVDLHVYIMCRGSDLLFNMLQAFSYITCAVMVSAIAGRLGCNRLFRFIAALLYMSMPIAYAEALTTQVDNFATLWLLFFIYILLHLVEQREKLKFDGAMIGKVCTMGLCVAWGYLAKPSVCFGMVIFALWLLVVCIIRRDSVKNLSGLVLCALPCVALPLVPEFVRNFRTFHSYADQSAGARQLVGTLQPSYLFVNFVKNFTFNMPIALLKDSENFFIKFARKSAKILNVELDAQSISEDGREFGLHPANTYGCDMAINPIVMWLFVFSLVLVIVCIKRIDWRAVSSGYLFAASISFCLFCVVLRWEPFVTRYMVSYLAVLCPMIASQIQLRTESDRGRPLRHALVGITCFLCVMEAISVTAFHYDIYAHRGADNRPYGYFSARRDEAEYYAKITDEIKGRGYGSVGLHLFRADDYEYPIWAMLTGQRIEHVLVDNESAVYADETFTPDCVIWFGTLPDEPVEINGEVYDQILDYEDRHYLLTK